MTPMVMTVGLSVVTILRSKTMMMSMLLVVTMAILTMVMPLMIALAVATMLAMVTLLVRPVMVTVTTALSVATLRFEQVTTMFTTIGTGESGQASQAQGCDGNRQGCRDSGFHNTPPVLLLFSVDGVQTTGVWMNTN